MGLTANERRVKDNEAMAMVKNIRTSAQKLNLVCQTIRGKDAGRALIDLEFSERRVAQEAVELFLRGFPLQGEIQNNQ